MAEARPVQQINNQVKPPKWKRQSNEFRPDTLAAVDVYLEQNPQYENRELIDVALREYLKLPEPTDE